VPVLFPSIQEIGRGGPEEFRNKQGAKTAWIKTTPGFMPARSDRKEALLLPGDEEKVRTLEK